MVQELVSRLRQRVSRLPRAFELHGRDILLVGFFCLLLLVCFIGYWSQKSLRELEDETAYTQRTDTHNLKTALAINEFIGEMRPSVSMLLGTTDNTPLMHKSARIQLDNLKGNLDQVFDDARKGSLGAEPEFHEVQTAFVAFWQSVNSQSPDWSQREYDVTDAARQLANHTQHQLEQHDERLLEMSRKARGRIGLATACVLIVGLIVTALTFFQIRQVFKRLTRAYSESADSRDYLRSLLNGLVSGLAVVESDGTISTVNNAFLAELRVGADDPVGMNYRDLFGDHPLLVESISRRFGDLKQNQKYCGRVKISAGQFDVYASPLAIAGEHRGLIMVFVDSTEVERVQMELRRNQALSAIGQMTAQVAHEIKNPLGSIGLALDLLRRRSADGEESEVIAVIDRSVDHLRAIVTELLEFTRPKELCLSTVNLNDLLENLLPMVADRSRAKDIAVERHFVTDAPESQYDESELRKLFLNLIINAIDASEAGGLIELETRLEGSGTFVVEVKDHGAGMNGETLQRLFEPFYTTKAKGTGLGMAIAKKIIELHRGDILVASEEGKGTTITVRLPVNYQTVPAEHRQPDSRAATSQHLG